MSFNSKISNLAIVIIFFIGCQKDINIPQPPYDSKVSIQSLIEPDSLPKVYLYHTVPFFDPRIFNAQLVLREAEVKILGDGNVDILHLDSIYDKVNCDYNFWFVGSIPIQSNIEYTLDISYNNQSYVAKTTTNLLASSIDSVSYVQKFNDLYGEHEGVVTYFKDAPGQDNYYRYEMIRPIDASLKHASIALSTACLGSDTVSVLEYGRSVYNDINLDGQQVKIVIEPAYTHREGIKTKVRIATIDKNAYEFLDQIDKQKLGVYNPFVEPKFLIDGQFGKNAIGYFGSMKRSVEVDFTFPE
jgi:hypothetical protein